MALGRFCFGKQCGAIVGVPFLLIKSFNMYAAWLACSSKRRVEPAFFALVIIVTKPRPLVLLLPRASRPRWLQKSTHLLCFLLSHSQSEPQPGLPKRVPVYSYSQLGAHIEPRPGLPIGAPGKIIGPAKPL
jgi:hypothetical protein